MLNAESILKAQARIAPFVRRTPLVRSDYLSVRTGGEVWLKAECLQPTGSFKVRGAVNKVGLLSAEEKARGIVTGSAGNHGLGVAFASQSWGGVQAHVYCPTTAPRASPAATPVATTHATGAGRTRRWRSTVTCAAASTAPIAAVEAAAMITQFAKDPGPLAASRARPASARTTNACHDTAQRPPMSCRQEASCAGACMPG